jgi:hypothetical protein
MKGYRESQPQIDHNSDSSEIKRAIQLLEILRPYVAAGLAHLKPY